MGLLGDLNTTTKGVQNVNGLLFDKQDTTKPIGQPRKESEPNQQERPAELPNNSPMAGKHQYSKEAARKQTGKIYQGLQRTVAAAIASAGGSGLTRLELSRAIDKPINCVTSPVLHLRKAGIIQERGYRVHHDTNCKQSVLVLADGQNPNDWKIDRPAIEFKRP